MCPACSHCLAFVGPLKAILFNCITKESNNNNNNNNNNNTKPKNTSKSRNKNRKESSKNKVNKANNNKANNNNKKSSSNDNDKNNNNLSDWYFGEKELPLLKECSPKTHNSDPIQCAGCKEGNSQLWIE